MTTYLRDRNSSVLSTKSISNREPKQLKTVDVLETSDDVMRGDGDSVFRNLDEHIHSDFHTAVSALSTEPSLNIWSTLYDNTDALQQALSILLNNYGDNAEWRSVMRHVYHERRAYELLLTEQRLMDEFEPYRETSVLGKLICTDKEFRMIYAVWRWCQDGAVAEPKGFAELACEYNSMANIRDIRSNTLRQLTMMGAKGDLGLDPDAKCVDEDFDNSERLTRIVFSLIRCGKLDEATSLVRSVGMPALAAPLSMYSFLSDPSLSPLDPMDNNYLLPKRRLVFMNTMTKLIDMSGPSPYRRMVWCALAGRRSPLLSMATRTLDRLWCMANSAIVNRLQEACTGSLLEDVPLTVGSIFAEITTEEKSPYFTIYGLLLRGEWSELINWLAEMSREGGRGMDGQLVRFVAHLVVVARILNHEHDIARSIPLLSSLLDSLCSKSLFHLVPFYAALMPRAMAEQKLLDIMKMIHEGSARSSYLAALEQADFDRDTLAILSSEHHPGSSLSPDARIDRLRWLLLNEQRTLEQTIRQANNLVRYFMMNDDDESASRVLSEMSSINIPSVLAVKRNDDSCSPSLLSEAMEYDQHQIFFETYHACTKFAEQAVKNSQEQQLNDSISSPSAPSEMNLAQRTERAVEERKRDAETKRRRATANIHKQKSMELCDKFLRHRGWFVESEDQPRSGELCVLRDRCACLLIELTLSACHTIGDVRAVLDVADMIADPDVEIETITSKKTLRHLLERIHRYAGHALS